MKENKEENIKNFLISNRGYLKKGPSFIARKFNITAEAAKQLLKSTKKTLQFEKTNTKTLKVREAQEVIAVPRINIISNKSTSGNILVISDTHLPFEREGALDFCNETKKKYNCTHIVHIGDEIDNCAISQYASDPDGLSPESEADKALQRIKHWYKAFPDVDVCIGNHTNRMFRLAHQSGIPKRMIKSYEQLWEAPIGWRWSESFDIQGVHYSHGSGMSGPNAAIKKAIYLRKSCVIGHIHTEATIQYNVSAIDKIFGMQVGCLVDDKSYAFAYAKDNVKKSILSCGVVLENGTLPILELMKI